MSEEDYLSLRQHLIRARVQLRKNSEFFKNYQMDMKQVDACIDYLSILDEKLPEYKTTTITIDDYCRIIKVEENKMSEKIAVDPECHHNQPHTFIWAVTGYEMVCQHCLLWLDWDAVQKLRGKVIAGEDLELD